MRMSAAKDVRHVGSDATRIKWTIKGGVGPIEGGNGRLRLVHVPVVSASAEAGIGNSPE